MTRSNAGGAGFSRAIDVEAMTARDSRITDADSPGILTAESLCWICGARDLSPVSSLKLDLHEYREQDPELAALTGTRVTLNRCAACGFGQPEGLPVLDRYFDRMYDQRWSPSWIQEEYESAVKDVIFDRILHGLERRVPAGRRTLLDIGAHVGRFVHRARTAGWHAEGLELNPRTAAFAARVTGARIRQCNVHDLDSTIERFDAITMTDVLEHVPHPARVLRRIRALLPPGGCLAVKVPSGPAQITKERWRGRLVHGYQPTVADNLVHVSHFSVTALRRALEDAGFVDVEIEPAAPELPAGEGLRGAASRALRLALFRLSSVIPHGAHSPLCLNLQAYARAR